MEVATQFFQEVEMFKWSKIFRNVKIRNNSCGGGIIYKWLESRHRTKRVHHYNLNNQFYPRLF